MRVFTRWDEVFSEKDTHETVSDLVTWHLSKIEDGPLRDRLLGVLVSGPAAICSFDFDYSDVTCNDARHLRQCLSFFTKRKDIDIGADKRGAALRKFRESEQTCGEMNRIFKLWASGKFCFDPDVEAVLFRAQQKIADILGDIPTLSSLKYGFGPGATTQVKRKISSARSKLSQKFCCSEDLLPLSSLILEQMPGWLPEGEGDQVVVDLEIHPCRFSLVPKTAKTDRGICTEPSLNVMFQRGVGDYISRRLRLFGVDLLDQTINRRLACEGSRSGALATLDLSMASDLISKEVVYHLLPLDWASFLAYGRSSYCEVEGEILKLEKFSSMGNGFTFPLESLIFYGLISACVDKGETVSVFGDDLIVPSNRYEMVAKVLSAVGFSVNMDKSYSSGPFRESCGGDYYLGTDIRPYYLKDRLTGQSAFELYNSYVRRQMLEPASIILSHISEPLRIWGPDGYGDGHLISDSWQSRSKGRERGWGGYTFDTYTLKPVKDYQVRSGDHVLPCYSIYINEPSYEGLFEPSRYLDPWGERPSTFPTYRSSSAFYRRGVLGVSIPGHKGYKRISIYSFTSG